MQLFGPSAAVTAHRSISSSSGGGSIGSYSNYLQPFVKLVATLRQTNSTCTVIEQGCGGLISASILMQPGASQCYIGSSVIYNTAQCQPLLPFSLEVSSSSSTLKNSNSALHPSIFTTKEHQPPLSLSQLFQEQLPLTDQNLIPIDDDEVQDYIQTKIRWTAQMAIEYCRTLKTDYAIAEGGAVGPTFRPKQLQFGFSVIAIAGRRRPKDTLGSSDDADTNNFGQKDEEDTVSILRQEIVFSSLPSSSDSRIQNMYTFSQTAANICHDVVSARDTNETSMNITDSKPIKTESSPPESPQPSKTAKVDPSSTTVNKTFDRAAHARSKPTLVDQLLYSSKHPSTKFMLLFQKQMLIHNNNENDDAAGAVQVAYYNRTELRQCFSENKIPFLNEAELSILNGLEASSFFGITSVFDRMDAISFLGTLRHSQQHPRDTNVISTTRAGTTTLEKDEEAIFAIDISTLFRNMRKSDQSETQQQQLLETFTKNGQLVFVDTRSSLPLLSCHNDREIVLYGTALMEWKRRNKHCSSCGSSATLSYTENGGTVGQCQNCQTKFWPRQDPSIIVLIVSSDRQRVLLANHVRHKHKKIYTTLAGFVEVGETMERAVVREAYEETGIRVDTTKPIQYIGTQPWPFPQSCMIGFIATADDTNQAITIDPTEIYDAQWFSKEDVLGATTVVGSTLQTHVTEQAFRLNPNLSCVIPPKGVIARQLIDTWLYEDVPVSKFLHEDATTTTTKPVVHQVRIV